MAASSTAACEDGSSGLRYPGVRHPIVVERFGSGIVKFGPFIVGALERHMLGSDGAEPVSWGMVRTDERPSSSLANPCDSGDQVDLKEAVSGRYSKLKERLGLKDATGTVGAFSPPTQLADVWERCGQKQLDADLFDLVSHVEANVTGGLILNCFQIGIGGNGDLGVLCAIKLELAFDRPRPPFHGPWPSIRVCSELATPLAW